MTRFRLVILLFGTCVQVLGKPSSSKSVPAPAGLETGREISGSIDSNNWYTNSHMYSVEPELSKTVYSVQPEGSVGSARDSYVDAASALGYPADGGVSQGQSHGVHGGNDYVQEPQFGGDIGPSSVFRYQLHPTKSHSQSTHKQTYEPVYAGSQNHETSIAYAAPETGNPKLKSQKAVLYVCNHLQLSI